MKDHPADIPKPFTDRNEWELYLRQLANKDETISFLLKTHLFSEFQMDLLLEDYLDKKREPLDPINLRFVQKLSLIDSLALLPQECIRSLRALNTLRNRCVHTFNTRPTIEDVRQVASAFNSFQPEGLQSVSDFLEAYMEFLFSYFVNARDKLRR
jgi:hypothetical protein